MPNQYDPSKVIISTVVSRETEAKLSKLAKAKGETKSKTAASILRDGLEGVRLSADDYAKIAADTKAAEDKRRKL